MATTTDLAKIFGALADDVLPHLMGKVISARSGLYELSSCVDAPVIDVPGLALPLLDYQWGGLAYANAARRCIIGDEMGLGKTATAIAALLYNRTFPALVVCPPSLTLNWVNELTKFAPGLSVRRITGTMVTPLQAADVYVIGDAVVSRWAKSLQRVGFAALVGDESHRYKNYKARRTAALRDIARKVDRDGLVLLLSGTAIKNRPDELITQLQILGVFDGLFGSPSEFLDRFYPLTGRNEYERSASDLLSLHEILRDHCYVRRTRDQVKVTPGKDRIPVAVELQGKAADDYRRAATDLRRFLIETKGVRAASKALKAEALARLTTLRGLIGAAKVEATVDYVQNLVDQGEQVIVFGVHRAVTKGIAAAFNAPTIIGGQSAEMTEQAKAAFQAGDAKVIVLNIEAGGVGHTLTAARHVVFAEFAWTPGDMEQCEDRADRIGQQHRVLSHWLVGTNGVPTVDVHLVNLLNNKKGVTGAVLDGVASALIDEESVQEALLEMFAA